MLSSEDEIVEYMYIYAIINNQFKQILINTLSDYIFYGEHQKASIGEIGFIKNDKNEFYDIEIERTSGLYDYKIKSISSITEKSKERYKYIGDGYKRVQ